MTEKKMPEIESIEDVPQFETEAEEAEFWATHELSEEILNRMRPVRESDSPAGRIIRRRIAEREAAKYSGKLSLRMSRSLHRDLSEMAKREGVSLNQLATTILARAVGE